MTRFLRRFAADRQAMLTLVEVTEASWASFQRQAALEPGSADEAEGLIAQELGAVRDMLANHRFDVGLFGLIKRGKSTITNALLGAEVSATSVTPETAVPVYVEYADEAGASVHFVDGRVEEATIEGARLYTSQETNRNNQLGVTYVRVRTPAELLAAGVRLIDTPGLDDAEADEVYTQRTIQELDSVDAGIIVVLSPPTIGGKEVEFLREVVSRNLEKAIVVVNMYPQHYYDEETHRDVMDYVTARVQEVGGGSVRIHSVCAIDAWEARRVQFEDRWIDSGAAGLLDDLQAELVAGSGRETIVAAARRLDTAVDLAAREVRLRRDLLSDPDELLARRDEMRAKIASFGDELETELEKRLERVDPLRDQYRTLLLSIFFGAKQQVRETKDLDGLEQVLRRFRREAEVAGNQATQQFRNSMGGILQRMEADLGERSEAVLSGIEADLHSETTGTGIFDDLDRDPALNPAVGGAAFGGLMAGGAGFVALGAVLGPLGLVGGALVGWKLGDLIAESRTMNRARDVALERLDEISDEFVAEFDRQVDGFVEAVRDAVLRRPAGLRAELESQLSAVERLTEDPDQLETRLAEYERLLTAFATLRERTGRIASEFDVLPTEAPADPADDEAGYPPPGGRLPTASTELQAAAETAARAGETGDERSETSQMPGEPDTASGDPESGS